ncbi:MAG: hypothetical protein AAF283_13395 [Cyanobacteria bacterium P01_A01_bin.70]
MQPNDVDDVALGNPADLTTRDRVLNSVGSVTLANRLSIPNRPANGTRLIPVCRHL